MPGLFDYHPEAVPISYCHENVDADEVIFYSSGQFMSRRGITKGDITVHRGGYCPWTSVWSHRE